MKPRHVVIAAAVVYSVFVIYAVVLARKYSRVIALRKEGYAAANRGDYATAARDYGDVVRLVPTATDTRFEFARALRRLGRTDEALVQLRRTISERGRFAPAHAELASLLAQKGDLDAAAGEYRYVIWLEPNMAVNYIGLAGVLDRKGDRKAALTALRTGARVEPDDGAVHVALGRELLAAGQRREAIVELRKATHNFPGYGPAAQALAEATAEKPPKRP